MAEPRDSRAFQETSTGHAHSTVGWLDAHFEACRPEYEAIARSVGIAPGWHVLDAGCGSGSYLPVLADLVGSAGHVTALDLAPENIITVAERVAGWALPCSVETQIGSLAALPFPDDSFDAVWCANVSQYLTDDELLAVLAEFRRVVRTGGLIAVKDANTLTHYVQPGDSTLLVRLWYFATATGSVATQARGGMRAARLRHWLERAGLAEVWQRTTLVERWAPLCAAERAYMGEFLAFFAQEAAAGAVPEADRAFWLAQGNPEARDILMNQPDFCWCEGHVVAVGRVAHHG